MVKQLAPGKKYSHLLKVGEVAPLLRLGRAQVWRLVRQGKLGAYRAGRGYLFDYERHIRPFLSAGEFVVNHFHSPQGQ